MKRHAAILLLPLTALAACSGGGGSGGAGSGGGGGGTIVTPSPSPSASASPTPAPVATASPTPTPTGDFFTRAAAMYTTQPDIAACQQGQLAPSVTAALLQSLNAIRALHQLPPATYSVADEPATQASALMMAANGQLNHSPPSGWSCYTSAGASAAGSSNLYGGFGAGLGFLSDEQILSGWMTEVNNLVADNVGHRRWLLDPFLGSVAYGRVAGRYQTNSRADAASIKVFNTSGAAGPNGPLPNFVAYPYGDYPARLYDTNALLSFGVIANKTSKFANANVSFANATVTVQQRGGAQLPISKVSSDNLGYGLPNNLQFFAAGIQQNVFYDVTISGVSGGGAAASYNYSFRIVP